MIWRAILIASIVFSFSCRSVEIAQKTAENIPMPSAVPTSTPKILTEEEIKRKVEVEKMMLKGDYLHDGSGELSTIGDIGSVPALLVVVRKYPSQGGSMICTKAHALSAL